MERRERDLGQSIGGGIMFNLSFFLVLTVVGAVTAVGHGLIPIVGSVPGWVMNLVGGGAAGGTLAGMLLLGLGKLKSELEREGVETRLVNSLLLGFVVSGIGAIFYLAIGLIFAAGVGVRIAQGSVLAGSLLLGLCLGYGLERPILGVGKPRFVTHRSHKSGATASKVLDTSVIIDGRIGDLLRTGFLEGEIVVPEFVLAELQNIADSSNSLRRRKGRRGLEVLHELMEDDSVDLRVSSQDYLSIKEVDRKLIRLVKEKGGALITTDYNLNRVAQVEGVKILNINELANAVKPRFIPGEEITVEVIDRGEEIGQGVGYLDDGTMVVVENGRRHIGRKVKTTVKSTLQTEAGRMLFVEPVGEPPRWGR
ncbi:PIN domain-containing protein [Candidatus Bipolaricaulota bacterium]|nr:PIN domain-containing protein [Candidatus Bipolaricaulota bacterium]